MRKRNDYKDSDSFLYDKDKFYTRIIILQKVFKFFSSNLRNYPFNTVNL